MMNSKSEQMLERYLDNVRFWLAAEPADDIIAEIREDLLSQIDGRNLSPEELADLLRKRGEPSFVAGQFGRHRPLIGSELMPAYWRALDMVLLRIVLPVHLLVAAPIQWLQQRSGPEASFIGFGIGQIWNLLFAMVTTAGAITVGFAFLERASFRIKWDPLKLGRLGPGKPAPLRVPKASVVADFVGGLVISVVWIAVLRDPSLASFQFGQVRISLAPVWSGYIWPMLFLSLAGVVLNWFMIAWPMRLRNAPWLRIGIDTANLILMVALVSHGGPWIESNSAKVHEVVNQWLGVGLGIAVLVAGWEVFQRVRCNMRRVLLA
jgi:hypothetical protein